MTLPAAPSSVPPRPTTALGAYRSEGIDVRVHTWLRWHTCPFRRLEQLVPRSADVLDVGCGHGLLAIHLALTSPDRRITGIDVDPNKLAAMRIAAAHAGVAERVTAIRGDATRPGVAGSGVSSLSGPVLDGAWDVVVCNDVLYLLGADAAVAVVQAMACAVRPGGTVIVKEMADRPRWKARLNHLQEQLAVRVVRITAGRHIEVVAVEQVVGTLRDAGCSTEVHDLSHHDLHPHVAVVATRPATATAATATPSSEATDHSDAIS